MPLLDFYQDITEVWQIIRRDEEVLALMDLSGEAMEKKVTDYIKENPNTDPAMARNIIIARSIIKRSQWEGLVDGKRICIYYRPFRMVKNETICEQIVEIDIHVPAVQEQAAYRLLTRIKDLIHDRKINGKRYYLEMPLGELATAQGFLCVGLRFRSYPLI